MYMNSNKMTKKIFVSYHFTATNGKFNGFGNYMAQFNPEEYEEEPDKFILDLQETIAHLLETKLNTPVAVKILFFR